MDYCWWIRWWPLPHILSDHIAGTPVVPRPEDLFWEHRKPGDSEIRRRRCTPWRFINFFLFHKTNQLDLTISYLNSSLISSIPIFQSCWAIFITAMMFHNDYAIRYYVELNTSFNSNWFYYLIGVVETSLCSPPII